MDLRREAPRGPHMYPVSPGTKSPPRRPLELSGTAVTSPRYLKLRTKTGVGNPPKPAFAPDHQDVRSDDDCRARYNGGKWPFVPDHPAEQGRPDDAAVIENRNNSDFRVSEGEG